MTVFNLKHVAGFGVIALIMTGYIALMGLSTNRASAVTIYNFSQDVLNNWHYMATSLDIPMENTKQGMLEPLIPERFGALDLAIFGYELVTPDYQADYRQLNMPRMIDKLHISTDEKGVLKYNVGGVQLLTIQDNDGAHGAAFYMDVPLQLIDEASRQYDGIKMQGESDGSGVVRYERLEDGRYVMGIFLPYT